MKPTNVEDVMTRTVVSVGEHVPFKELVRMMHENRVGGVPIVDATNRLVGIVTERISCAPRVGRGRTRVTASWNGWSTPPGWPG